MATCYKCGAEVSFNEIGLNKKLVNRGVERFLCFSCLGEEFKMTRQTLDKMIVRFRKAGCVLFGK